MEASCHLAVPTAMTLGGRCCSCIAYCASWSGAGYAVGAASELLAACCSCCVVLLYFCNHDENVSSMSFCRDNHERRDMMGAHRGHGTKRAYMWKHHHVKLK